MNKIIIIPLLFLMQSSYAQPLVLLNWADYIDPEVLAEFQRQTGIEVKEVYFDSDDGRNELMTRSKGKGYDLIMLNGLAIDLYRKQNWLAQIPSPQPNNLIHIEKKWSQAFASSEKYAVPYFWGTTGIAYRKDLINQPINSWQQIFSPTDELKGKITMMDSAREVMAASLKSLGYSINSRNNREFSAALTRLQDQSQHVKTYIGVDFHESSALLSGETLVAMMYSGDALMLQDLSANIEYILPQEGSNIWVDFLSVSAFSPQKENAWKFINFINQPRISAQLANYVYCAPANKAARKFLSQEFLANPTIFPNKEDLNKSELFKPIPARQLKKLTTTFKQLEK